MSPERFVRGESERTRNYCDRLGCALAQIRLIESRRIA